RPDGAHATTMLVLTPRPCWCSRHDLTVLTPRPDGAHATTMLVLTPRPCWCSRHDLTVLTPRPCWC
ncbi:MAG: hypothetical protein Q7T78_00465, partial [Rhodoferax sp.]|nr:hypothetical protein [Rhodoferax sp.]